MEYLFLGKTGLRVSLLGFGCMTLETGFPEELGHRLLDQYVESGGNLIDVADNYPGAEESLGKWLKSHGGRSQLVLQSKVRFPTGSGPNDVGLTRKHILESLENSLRLLHTDYLDIYMAHCWDFITPIEETLRVFDDLVTSGKIRYIGASNFSGWQLMKALMTSSARNLTKFASVQVQYNLLCRSPEWEIIPACLDMGVTVTAWSPLAAGWLTGKYHKDSLPPKGSRLANAVRTKQDWENIQSVALNASVPRAHQIEEAELIEKRINSVEIEKRWQVIHAVAELAKAQGRSPSQVALAWLLDRPEPALAIIGVTKASQLEDNLGAVGFTLTPEEKGWLNKISNPGTPYPVDFFNKYGIPLR